MRNAVVVSCHQLFKRLSAWLILIAAEFGLGWDPMKEGARL